MSFSYTRTITTNGLGMPMMPMRPMMGMGGCFSPMMGGSIFCRPYPMMAVGGAVAAGACIGAALACPGVMNAIGSGLKWGYNNIILPVWNGIIKPVGLWTYNNILKPIGSGLKWVWDHTLGWVLKKLETATSKKKVKTENTQDTNNSNKAKKVKKSKKVEQSAEETIKPEGTPSETIAETEEV